MTDGTQQAPGTTAPAPGRGEPLLSVRGLRTVITLEGHTFDVVRDLSLEVYPNEIVGLVGESGCGKSLTALSVMRLLPEPVARVVAGDVRLEGQDLLALTPAQMRAVRAERISMIFQDPLTSLDPSFTVGAVLSELIRVHRPMDKASALEMAAEVLAEVDIPAPKESLRRYPHQLSGGMRQRVMIALALVLDPVLLIADEPTTALDVTVQAQILDRLLVEQQQRGMGMLLITHDLGIVASIAHRVAVMYSGEIVEQATVDELFENPRHPYTQGLLRSLPEIDLRKAPLHTIRGRVPPPQLVPPGCFFAPRCEQAIPRCWEEHPPLEPEGTRLLRCYNPTPFVL